MAALAAVAACLGLTAAAPPSPPPPGVPVVGMMYEGWHGPATVGLRDPSTALTVEAVLRSNGTLTMSQMDAGIDLATAMSFHFHKQPADGFYCIYRKRPNETKGVLPRDCDNITATLARHAAMLVDAGVEFVVADSTNIQSTGAAADALQLRPFEVLLEEWAALRAKGVPTPRVAVWQNLQDPNGDLWRVYADTLYKDPRYTDLIFTDAAKGNKQVFFTTADPQPSLVAQLEQRGLAVVVMWALRDNFGKGEWGFMSPCRDPATGGFSSSVPPQGAATGCNQSMTVRSPIGARGTSMTVGPSYQLSYSALPFQASGKLGGLTLKRQFETVFAHQGELDFVMVGTFNEHVAQPQANPYAAKDPAAIAMGLETDPDNHALWVDMYGDGITRDLEPTTEDSGAMWQLFHSCMRVLRGAGGSGCANATAAKSEACCDRDAPESSWTPVWSLASAGDTDHVLTVDQNERDVLVKSGRFTEYCAPFSGAGAFCEYGAGVSVDPTRYARSPFLLRSVPSAGSAGVGGTSPVVRCVASAGGGHLYAPDAGCYGLGKAESTLGHAAAARSSNAPRSLRQCATASSSAAGRVVYHTSLDAPCADRELAYLGYVH